jgi:hypothetical protein
MNKLLVLGLHDEERRIIIDSIKAEAKCDVRALMLAEMFELLELLLTEEITIEQLRELFTKSILLK